MGTALAIYEKVANPIAFCDAMAETCAAITGCSLQQGKGVALTCLCEGITPHEYARTYHNIQGKSTMRADAMLAHFRTKHGGSHKIVERSANRAALVLTNADGDEYTAEFTWEEAQASRWPWKNPDDHAKGLKDNWSTPTDQKNMLWARLVSDSIRAFQPEVVAGIYTPEEIADLDVISTTITTAGQKRTAAEVMAAASEQPAVENATDAEFTVATEPESTEPPFAEQPQGEGFATAAQCERLNDLRLALNPPQATWDKALKERGATTVHGLTEDGAKDLIEKLEARRRRTAPEKN